MCSVCGSDEVYAKGRCYACYKYQYRTGQERPEKWWGRVARHQEKVCECGGEIVTRVTAYIRTEDKKQPVSLYLCERCRQLEDEIRSIRR